MSSNINKKNIIIHKKNNTKHNISMMAIFENGLEFKITYRYAAKEMFSDKYFSEGGMQHLSKN